ncbi:MAG: hypothetical protein NW217_01920 [Hyphomicrobiaceae bacterium]|nr:hypothetical protein [Hyphomicrobiaceae bacterium]
MFGRIVQSCQSLMVPRLMDRLQAVGGRHGTVLARVLLGFWAAASVAVLVLIWSAPLATPIGSEPARPHTLPEKAFDTNEATGFMTETAIGSRYIGQIFDAPIAMARIEITYGLDYRNARDISIAVETSQSGNEWQQQAAVLNQPRAGPHHLSLSAPVAATHWRVRFLSGPTSPLLIKEVRFVPDGWADRWRESLQISSGFALTVLVLAPLVLLPLAGWLTGRAELAGPWFFGGCAMAGCLWTMMLFMPTAGTPLIVTDTFGYVEGDAMRTPGVHIWVAALEAIAALPQVARLQIILLIAATIALFWTIARITGWWLASGLGLLWVLLSESVVGPGLYVASEGLFQFGVLIFAAAVLAALHQYADTKLLIAGVGIAIAVVVKGVGIALVAPAAIIALFFPGRVLRAFALLIVVPITSYLGMCTANYISHGHFSASTQGSLSLFGYTTWFVEHDPSDPDQDKLRRLVDASQETRRRHLAEPWPWRYGQSQSENYNAHFGRGITALGIASGGLKSEGCGDMCGRFAKLAIQQHPDIYLRNVTATYVLLWEGSTAARPASRKLQSACERLEWMTSGDSKWRADRVYEITALRPPSQTQMRACDQRAGRYAGAEASWAKALEVVRSPLTLLVAAASVGLSAIFFLGRTAPPVLQAAIALSLIVNAYFGAHALAHVFLPRYSLIAMPLVVAAALLIACYLIRVVRSGDRQGNAP